MTYKRVDGLGEGPINTGRFEVAKCPNGNPNKEEVVGTFDTEAEAVEFFERVVGEQAIRFSKDRGFGCEVQVVEENSVVVCDGTSEGEYVAIWIQPEIDYSGCIQ